MAAWVPLQGVSRFFHLTRKKIRRQLGGGRYEKRRCRGVQLGPGIGSSTLGGERGVLISKSAGGATSGANILGPPLSGRSAAGIGSFTLGRERGVLISK